MTTGNFRKILSVLLLITPLAASAGVYKCVDENGRSTFQEQECPASSSSSEVNITSSKPSSPPNSSEWAIKTADLLVAKCMSATNMPIDRIKYQRYCECSAKILLSDPKNFKTLMDNKDTKGLMKLGLDSGIDCRNELR